MSRILLSASYPTGDRGEEVRPYSLSDIDLATTAVVEAVLLRGCQLRFGGHPTISPLVLDRANLLRAGRRVEIYQSALFAEEYTDHMRRLVRDEGAMLVETPSVEGGDPDLMRAESLSVMRTTMLADPIDAAFFVGGMSGLVEEIELLRTASPEALVFLLRRPGGMARRLADGASSRNVNVLRGSAYDVLVADALDLLG